ncbi:MAG: hypothetical protein V1725_06870 [archaeon]
MDLKKEGSYAIFCPRCNSTRIFPAAGGMTGTYQCQDCGYCGSLVIEKTFRKG